jgi:hypothetical protein
MISFAYALLCLVVVAYGYDMVCEHQQGRPVLERRRGKRNGLKVIK